MTLFCASAVGLHKCICSLFSPLTFGLLVVLFIEPIPVGINHLDKKGHRQPKCQHASTYSLYHDYLIYLWWSQGAYYTLSFWNQHACPRFCQNLWRFPRPVWRVKLISVKWPKPAMYLPCYTDFVILCSGAFAAIASTPLCVQLLYSLKWI